MPKLARKLLISAALSLAGSLLFTLGTWLSGGDLSWSKLAPALAASIGSWLVAATREFGKVEGTNEQSDSSVKS